MKHPKRILFLSCIGTPVAIANCTMATPGPSALLDLILAGFMVHGVIASAIALMKEPAP